MALQLPIHNPIVFPSVLAGRQNGRLPVSLLWPTPGQAGGPTVRLVEPAARGWRAMCAAAKTAGHILKVTSSADSYRSYEQQVATWTARYEPDNFPGSISSRVWPDHYDLEGRFVAAHRWYQKPDTAVAAYPGSCVEESAVVLTRRGLVPIGEVVVGDEVWTHLYRWRPVTHIYSFNRPVVRMAGAGHPGIDVTRDHRWWVFDGWHRAGVRKGIRYAGQHPLVRTTTEVIGDLWLSPDYVDGIDAPAYATEDWVRWAGAWVADGSLHYVNGVLTEGLIYPRNSKSEQIKEWAKAAGIGLTENRDRGDGTLRLRFGRAEARKLEEHFGRLSTERTIPAWLLANAQKLAAPFLAGFLHGDGHHRPAIPPRLEHWSFSTSSRSLAVGLRLLGQSIGWHCYLSGRRWTPPSVVNERLCVPTAETWSLTMYESKPPVGTRLWNHEGYIVGRVRRVADRCEVRRVVDLTVKDDESFCVDGIYTHNSNHGWGLAADIGEESDGDAGIESLDDATLNWLIANAHLFGFSAEIQSEKWHWRRYSGDVIEPAILAYEQGVDDMTPEQDATLKRIDGRVTTMLYDLDKNQWQGNENNALKAHLVAQDTKLDAILAAIAEIGSSAPEVAVILAGMQAKLDEQTAAFEAELRDAVADLGEGGAAQVREDA